MQKVVIVNLNGIAYHLEEGGYVALGAYLDRAESQLRENPDRKEIIGDLEQAIADKCGRYLGAHKTVVTGADMATILEEMGPVHDEADTTGSEASAPGHADRPGASASGSASSAREGEEPGTAPKRLYRMLDTGVLGGVCSGLAVFLDMDVTLVRIGVALLALFEVLFVHTPFVLVAYLVALFVVPVADTSEERAAARGIPFNAQQLIDEAKRNFERIGERDWKHTRREWRKQRRWERKYERQARRAARWPPVGFPGSAPATYGSQLAAGFVTPVLTILSVAAFWLAVYAAISLASTGAVRGWHLPADVPLWLGLLGLLFVYSALVWPLHAARRASYFHLGGSEYWRYQAFDGFMSAILGIAIVWAAYHYNPEVREWLRHLPDAWHNVAGSFRSQS